MSGEANMTSQGAKSVAPMLEELSPEERSSKARGYKAAISNPNTSEEAKQNAREALEALGGEDAFYGKKDEGKDAK